MTPWHVCAGSTESALTTIECSFLSPANSMYGSHSLLGAPMRSTAAALPPKYDAEAIVEASAPGLASSPQGGFAAGRGMYALAEGDAAPGGGGALQLQAPAAVARAPDFDMTASFGAPPLLPSTPAALMQPGAAPCADILWPNVDTALSAQQVRLPQLPPPCYG